MLFHQYKFKDWDKEEANKNKEKEDFALRERPVEDFSRKYCW